MKEKFYKLKFDKYTKARGGDAVLYSIACNKCRHEVLLYQKDGPGPLLRMYADKIRAPRNLVKEIKQYKTVATMSDLVCPACDRVLAAPIIYEKEARLAFRLFVGAIRKRISDGDFPKGK